MEKDSLNPKVKTSPTRVVNYGDPKSSRPAKRGVDLNILNPGSLNGHVHMTFFRCEGAPNYVYKSWLMGR